MDLRIRHHYIRICCVRVIDFCLQNVLLLMAFLFVFSYQSKQEHWPSHVYFVSVIYNVTSNASVLQEELILIYSLVEFVPTVVLLAYLNTGSSCRFVQTLIDGDFLMCRTHFCSQLNSRNLREYLLFSWVHNKYLLKA